nr:MAG TPA: Cytochrome oxidase c subunit VIII [Caudoviricetes sp.]
MLSFVLRFPCVIPPLWIWYHIFTYKSTYIK